MTTTDNRLQVRIGDKEGAWLTDRSERMHTGSIHVQARMELGMWRDALEIELRRMRFTVAELNCMADAMNGTLIQPGIALTVPIVFAEMSDAFELAPPPSSYGEKWGIDEAALLAKIRALGPTADHALHDAISRWWEKWGGRQIPDDDPTEGWAAVGLRVVSAPAPAGPGPQKEQ